MRQRGHSGRVDGTHVEIVDAFRRMGAYVRSSGSLGDGFPDLIVAAHGHNVLVEVKTPRGKLNAEQETFHRMWPGWTAIVRTVDDAAAVMRRIRELP